MTSFEDFHIVARKEVSERIATLLRDAGIRIQERVLTEIGHPEYVIAVAVEDLARAEEVFSHDVGSGKAYTSQAEPGAAPDRGDST